MAQLRDWPFTRSNYPIADNPIADRAITDYPFINCR